MADTPRFNYFNNKIVPEDLIPIPQYQSYEVIFNHMLFQRRDLEAFMPKKTFYFAITRDPEQRFLSSFFYYGLADYLKNKLGLLTVKDAVMYVISGEGAAFRTPEVYNSFASDTGLNHTLHRDVGAITAHVEKLERDLDLVLLVEYFDESLVLLKRKACLSTQDILYLVQNARAPSNVPHLSFTAEERAALWDFQMADVLMYDHFYRRFWGRAFAEGPEFFAEVQRFKQIQKMAGDFCRLVTSKWDFVVIPRSAWNEEFTVTARDCRLMATPELKMQTYITDRAMKLFGMSQTNKGIVG